MNRSLPQEKEDKVPVGIRRGLLEEVDRLVKSHPQFGLKNRNDFGNRAFAMLLRDLKHEIYLDLIMKQYAEGVPSPLKELKRLGIDI